MKANRLTQSFSAGIAVCCLCLSSLSYGNESITQTSNAPQSQNIVADTVNIKGLAKEQVDLIIQHIDRAREDIKRSQKSSEDARKNIEIIDKELSKIQRENFDSLPEDAKEWVNGVKNQIDTFRERDSLIQESLQNEIKNRENLSQQMIVKMRNLFHEILSIVDSRLFALQEEEDLNISYSRSQNFSLFIEKEGHAKSILLGHIIFMNGSSIDIILLPGTLVQGIAQRPPELQFFQTIGNQKSHSFSFRERLPNGGLYRNSPLVPPLAPKRAFNDVEFDPHQKQLGETIRKEFLSMFTQFIGSVLTKDMSAQ